MSEADTGNTAALALRSSMAQLPAWTATFELMSDPTRLRILVAIHAAPQASVGEIAAAAGLSPNTTSQALAALATAGVVSVRRDGRYRRWSLKGEAAHRLLHHINAPHSSLHPEH